MDMQEQPTPGDADRDADAAAAAAIYARRAQQCAVIAASGALAAHEHITIRVRRRDVTEATRNAQP